MYFSLSGHVDPGVFLIFDNKCDIATGSKCPSTGKVNRTGNRYARGFLICPVNGQQGNRTDHAAYPKIKYTLPHFSIHDCPHLSYFSDALPLLSKTMLYLVLINGVSGTSGSEADSFLLGRTKAEWLRGRARQPNAGA
ncbi:MAG: hypothetical protein P8X90_18425, partial [Desulfobacterales bacterium]